MEESKPRTDELGRAYKGSQLQVQIYVSRRRTELSSAVAQALKCDEGTQLVWVAPLEKDRFAEPFDEDFLRVLGLERWSSQLASFWPRRGPHWDALARCEVDGKLTGVALVEGKSYPLEVHGPGCLASDDRSFELIQQATSAAKQWFGVDPDANWLGPLYQYANRLSHVYFFHRTIGVPASLVNLYFVGDTTTNPTSEIDWYTAIRDFKIELGFHTLDVPWVADVFLPARRGAELHTDAAT